MTEPQGLNCMICWMRSRNCYGERRNGDIIKLCDTNCNRCLIKIQNHETKNCTATFPDGVSLLIDHFPWHTFANCPNCEPQWNNFVIGRISDAFATCTKCRDYRIRNTMNEQFWKQYKR